MVSVRALSATSCSTVARSRLEPRSSTAALGVAMRALRTSTSRASSSRLFNRHSRIAIGSPGVPAGGAGPAWTWLQRSPETTLFSSSYAQRAADSLPEARGQFLPPDPHHRFSGRRHRWEFHPPQHQTTGLEAGGPASLFPQGRAHIEAIRATITARGRQGENCGNTNFPSCSSVPARVHAGRKQRRRPETHADGPVQPPPAGQAACIRAPAAARVPSHGMRETGVRSPYPDPASSSRRYTAVPSSPELFLANPRDSGHPPSALRDRRRRPAAP